MNKQISNVLDFYYSHCSLQEKERTGWKKWNVAGRRESITDHISNAQALAWALYSEFDLDISIERVISMLSLHEKGEEVIGDITRYDNISKEEKEKREKEAVDMLCSKLKKGNYIVSLIDEFNRRETPEAQFAYLCDKLDCDLRARFYSASGRCSIENATYQMVSIPEIQEIIKNGAKTVWDVFYEADKFIYEGTFLEDFFSSIKEL